MRLVTFVEALVVSAAQCRIGVVVDDASGTMVIDLSVAAPTLPTDMVAFLATRADGLALARAALQSTVG